MCDSHYENKYEPIAYCFYCKSPINEGEGHICVDGNYYHYSFTNPLLNCYFPDKKEE